MDEKLSHCPVEFVANLEENIVDSWRAEKLHKWCPWVTT